MKSPTRQIATAMTTDSAAQHIASTIAETCPGNTHFIIADRPFVEDATMQDIVRIMHECMDHIAHIPCEDMEREDVLEQIGVAIEKLTQPRRYLLRQAIVCTDLPWGSGDYRTSLAALLEIMRVDSITMVANVVPEAEDMLSEMDRHERYYLAEYQGPMEPTPAILERREAAAREPFDLFLALCLPSLMTVDEAAKLIRVGPERVRRLIRRGEIEGVVYIGNNIRIHTNCILKQYGITVREALPCFIDPLDYFYRVYVEGEDIDTIDFGDSLN